ncbi:hypothetical protein KBD69_03675 [Candidatus Woesebacteria bacterium]|nr:hypothetical protein [Candidatus Woesebacteria bacterium]
MSISTLEKLGKMRPIDTKLAKEFAYEIIRPDQLDNIDYAALHLMLTHNVRGTPIIPSWEKATLDEQYVEGKKQHRILILGFGATAVAAAKAVVDSGHIAVVMGDEIGGQAARLISVPLHEDTTKAGGGTTIIHTMTQPGILALPGQNVDLSNVSNLAKDLGVSAIFNATGSLIERKSKPLKDEYNHQDVVTIRELVDGVNKAIRSKKSITETTGLKNVHFVALEGLGKTVMNDGGTDAIMLEEVKCIESASGFNIDPRKLAKNTPGGKTLRESEGVRHNLTRLNPENKRYYSTVVVGRGTRETSRALPISGSDQKETRDLIKNGDLSGPFEKLLNLWYPSDSDSPRRSVVENLITSDTNLTTLSHVDQKEVTAILGELTRLHNPKYQAKNKKEFSEWQEGVGFSFLPESTIVGTIRHPDTGRLIGAKIRDNQTGKQKAILAHMIVTGHGTEPNLLSEHLSEPLDIPSIDAGFAVAGTTISGATIDAKSAVKHLLSQLGDPEHSPESNLDFVRTIHAQQVANGSADLTKYFLEKSDPGYVEEWLITNVETSNSIESINEAISQYQENFYNNPNIKVKITAELRDQIDHTIIGTVLARYLKKKYEKLDPKVIDQEMTTYAKRLSLDPQGRIRLANYTSPLTLTELHADIERWQSNQKASKVGKKFIAALGRHKSEAIAAVGGLLTGAAASLLNLDPRTFVETTTALLWLDSVVVSGLSTLHTIVPKHREKLGKAARFAELLGIGLLGTAAGFGLVESVHPSPTAAQSLSNDNVDTHVTSHKSAASLNLNHGSAVTATPSEPTITPVDTYVVTPTDPLIPSNFANMNDEEILKHVTDMLGDSNWVNNGPFNGYDGRPVKLADVITRMISANRTDFTQTEMDAVKQISETTNLAELIKLKNSGLYQVIFGNLY